MNDASKVPNPLLMLSGRVGGAMMSAITFWVVVILLPERAPDRVPWGVWIPVVLLGLIALAGPILVYVTRERRDRITVPAPYPSSRSAAC